MSESQFLLYRAESGESRLLVRLEDESVWLTQAQMVDLFQTTKQNISLHIANVFEEGELSPMATVKEYLTVRQEGGRQVQRRLTHYNLDVIISVGYRVKSQLAVCLGVIFFGALSWRSSVDSVERKLFELQIENGYKNYFFDHERPPQSLEQLESAEHLTNAVIKA
ncbi:MAG TPA: RhuM family protein [Fimbriimonadaceae bacterium]